MNPISRRTLIRFGVGAGLIAMAGGSAGCAWPGPGGTLTIPAPQPAPADRRRLVMIELAGGCDGLSMVVPYSDDRYRALRPATGVDPAKVHRIDGRFGFHPSLQQLSTMGASVVTGVGVANPDLSHFEMLQRWWTGDPDGRTQPTTGFLGRLCDVLGDPAAPAVGVSLGFGATQPLACERVSTMSIDAGAGGAFPVPETSDDGLRAAWLAAQRAMAHPDRTDTAMLATARAATGAALRFTDIAGTLSPAGDSYPATDLGAQLSMAARLIDKDELGLRIVHVPVGADFDTHDNHLPQFAALMADLDEALAALRHDLRRRDIDSSVLIGVFTEFGRRAADNGSSGLDHGTASTAMLMGPTQTGLFGEPPSLNRLDGDGNLIATVNMTEFYATIAEAWFGVPADVVLPGRPTPIPGIIPVVR